MSARFKRVALIGVGLIGASLAAALKRAGAAGTIAGVGRSQANLDAARDAGIVDETGHETVSAVAGADLVVLAAPVDTCVRLLDEIADAIEPGAVVTDVASVKAPLVAAADRLALDGFAGSHPMAGGTKTGAAAADAALFQNKPVVITPGRTSSEAAIAAVEELWKRVGANPVRLDADRHDRAVASISHLPQMIAFALAATVAERDDTETAIALAGAGFRDMTRLAASDPAMWTAIAATNKDAVSQALTDFIARATALRSSIDASDEEGLAETMKTAAELRRKLETK